MTLFGQTLDGQQIFGLVSLLTVLAFWIVVLGRERSYRRWLRHLDIVRRQRRDAQHHGGPWG